MKYIFLSLFLFISFMANAATVYKHNLPFKINLRKEDSLTVYYDFSGKGGIYCEATASAYKINFTYKGHEKSALLPITLQCQQVPAGKREALADVVGKFSIEMTELYPQSMATIQCKYIK